MDRIAALRQSGGWIGTVGLFVLLICIIYAVYRYIYPPADPSYVLLLEGDADGKKTVRLTGDIPPIYTGGDFTLSFWIYIDDFNYRAAQYKHLFSLEPELMTASTRMPLVGVLTPLTNGLMVRAATAPSHSGPPAPGSMPSAAASGHAGPDITVGSSMMALMNQQTSLSIADQGVDQPCDIKDVALQRWVNVTIVSSGRILDVYMDGKLSRSCVLDNVVAIPRGKLRLNVCAAGGFGGRVSTIQMWGAQLTPDVIYGVYQAGPVHYKHDIFQTLAQWMNINVSYTAPGATAVSAGSIWDSLSAQTQQVQSALSAVDSAAIQSLCQRL